MMTNPSEHKEQTAFVKYLTEVEKLKVFHFPPGRRGGFEGGFLKMMGVKSGVPDLFIPDRFLWVEIKRIGGRLSKDQIKFRDERVKYGYSFITGYGYIDTKQKYLTWREFYEKNSNNFRLTGICL